MGKSTLYQSLQSLQDMPRVNTDEILRDFGDWRNMADVMTAGKIAVKKIDQYFGDSITDDEEGECYEPEFLLPICNSPGMGVCGYEGSDIYPDQFEADKE